MSPSKSKTGKDEFENRQFQGEWTDKYFLTLAATTTQDQCVYCAMNALL